MDCRWGKRPTSGDQGHREFALEPAGAALIIDGIDQEPEGALGVDREIDLGQTLRIRGDEGDPGGDRLRDGLGRPVQGAASTPEIPQRDRFGFPGRAAARTPGQGPTGQGRGVDPAETLGIRTQAVRIPRALGASLPDDSGLEALLDGDIRNCGASGQA